LKKVVFYSILCFFVMGSLVVLEYAYRPFYMGGFASLVDPYEDHPRRPNLSIKRTWGTGLPFWFYTNDLGWRDDIPNKKVDKDPQNFKRIVFLGDSFVEGLGYDFEETFVGLIEQSLNDGKRRVEVLNGGTSSFSPLLSYNRLRLFFDEGFRADLLVLMPDYSDIQDDALRDVGFSPPDNRGLRRALGIKHFPLLRWLFNHSAIARAVSQNKFIYAAYKFANETMIRWVSRREGTADVIRTSPRIDTKNSVLPNDLKHERRKVLAEPLGIYTLRALPLSQQTRLRWMWPYHPESLRGWADRGLRVVKHNLGRIINLAQSRNIPVLLVAYPHPILLYSQNSQDLKTRFAKRFPELIALRKDYLGDLPQPQDNPYLQAITEVAQTSKVPFANLFPVFLSRGDWPDLFIAGDIHFNRAGMTVVAKALLPQIQELIK